ncbi:MAG: helix-turn-helix transcriptional regulator [Thermoplasmata archaeon]|uniref:Helix-turn-helix transcriptional regulator n=1 Tax=Candidatus Sysuiplasma superficiale TaxID=2823368 RepID=A0A8J8CCL6_9ARCH|nr:helix-turn-helix transcriptional regulator [Candidatus Sysuiplasma superficiale]MBX8643540.1 helix-turn-helix transcriptional regulator [Candidatus Sysuiplasma superficiale]
MNAKSEGKVDLCPIAATIRKIGSEAKLVVIRYLSNGPTGFNDLLRKSNLSAKTLSSTLKALEKEEIVRREILSTRPFKVSYSLTEKGQDLRPMLEKMGEWGKKWIVGNGMEMVRVRYDTAEIRSGEA